MSTCWDAFPMTTSIPPLFSFFYHLVFEDVRIEIVQADETVADRER